MILVGIQASEKTTFYRERFFDTHVRISLDMLRTRHRERVLVETCVAAKQPFVMDQLYCVRISAPGEFGEFGEFEVANWVAPGGGPTPSA